MRLFAAAAALGAWLFASTVQALGFGEIQVQSALNQPLRASIPLLAVKPSERESVSVSFADSELFKRFGIERPGALDDIRLELDEVDTPGRMRVRLTSRRPVREPLLTFLVEAEWAQGRAIREYTVMLDPPVAPPETRQASTGDGADAKGVRTREEKSPQTATVQSPPASPSQPATSSAQPEMREKPAERTREPSATASSAARETEEAQAAAAEPEAQPAASATPRQRRETPASLTEGARRYGPVQPQDTLWSIAHKHRPDPSISMDQMLLAIYQANPEAFDGNMNLMHKGAVLKIPREAAIRQIDAGVAEREVQDQKTAYARLQRRQRRAKQTRSAETEVTSGQAAPAATQGGQLKLEPAEPGRAQADAQGDADAEPKAGEPAAEDAEPSETMEALAQTARQGDKQPSADETDDEQAETQKEQTGGQTETAQDTDAAADIAEPKKAQAQADTEDAPLQAPTEETGDDGEELAAPGAAGDAQPTEADDSDGTSGSGTAETGVGPRPSDPAGGTDDTQVASAADATGTAESAPEANADTETAAQENEAATGAGDEVGTGEAETAASADEAAASASDEGSVPLDPLAGQAEAVVPEGSAGLLTPRRVLLALASLLLLVSLVLFFRRRQYKPVPADFATGATDTADSGKTEAGATGPAAAKFAAAAAPAEEVDIDELLEDADSHIAFDLYDEALGALEIGLERAPDNEALRRKVLEVHHAAGDRDAFLRKVDDYYPKPDPNDRDWQAVAAMGRELAPDDDRFAVAAAHHAPAEEVAEPGGESEEIETEAADTERDERGEPLDADFAAFGTGGETRQPADDAGAAERESGSEQESDLEDFDLSDFDVEPGGSADTQDEAAGTEPDAGEKDAGEKGEEDFDLSELSLDEGGGDSADLASRESVGDDSDDSTVAASDTGSDTTDDEDLSLDVGFEEDTGERTERTSVSESDADQGGALEDEFDIGDLDLDTQSSEESPTTKAPGPEQSEGSPGLDSDERESAETSSTEVEGEADEPPLSPDDFDSDLPTGGTGTDEPAATGTGSDEDASDAEGLELTPAGTQTSDRAGDADAGATAGESESAGDESDFDQVDNGFGADDDTLSDDDEMATKLDLAQAYLDMGENDMARSLLEEVISSGDDAQRQEAERLLGSAG